MWKVFCDSDYVSFNIETDDAEDTESIKDEIIDEVHEILDDWIGDFSGNDDVFSPYMCEKMIDEYTRDRLTSTFTTVFYTCEEWSDYVLQCTRQYCILDILLDIWSSYWCDDNVTYRVAQYIERQAGSFASDGYWHFALMNGDTLIENPNMWPEPMFTNEKAIWRDVRNEYTPVIWFGPDGVPTNDKFIIWKNPEIFSAYENYLDPLWTDTQTWETLEDYLDESDDGFLCWYCAEIGLTMPDFSEILTECPVGIQLSDSFETAHKKVDAYFAGVYHSAAMAMSQQEV